MVPKRAEIVQLNAIFKKLRLNKVAKKFVFWNPKGIVWLRLTLLLTLPLSLNI